MSFAKIRPRRGTATAWSSVNPVLAEGEIGIEVPDSGVGTGKVKIKFGDGSTAWNDLPYGVVEGIGASDIVTNAVTDSDTKVASASVAKSLQDQVNSINDKVSKKLTYLGSEVHSITFPSTASLSRGASITIPFNDTYDGLVLCCLERNTGSDWLFLDMIYYNSTGCKINYLNYYSWEFVANVTFTMYGIE